MVILIGYGANQSKINLRTILQAAISPTWSLDPKSGVPALQLDNGNVIAESMAICRYFDAIQPEPFLFGESPEEKGLVEMWSISNGPAVKTEEKSKINIT